MLQIASEAMNTMFAKIDLLIAEWMNKWSSSAIRISFGIIFIWFGILKVLDVSSAESLLKATVVWMPFGTPELWLVVIGWWEVVIGVTFLFPNTTKIAIGLLFLQMFGTFMPLVLLPNITFQNGNILMPSLEGQYIIKNVMIISAALALGGKYHKADDKTK
jgi:uncharacterized membrane protein YphA (DoxX/SURF4 family)